MTPDSQPHFNETQWLKLLFLLADTQNWLDDMSKEAFLHLPLPDKKKLMRKTYYLTAGAMAHIIERHYYKISRHPQAGKFHIPVIEIVQHIRDGSMLTTEPVNGSLNFQRTLHTADIIGYDNDGQPTSALTILTDAGGRVITAFPGTGV